MKKILVTPANFGLGHATRTIPIIKELEFRGHEINIATNGSALTLLKKEFPQIKYYELPTYPQNLQSAGSMSTYHLLKEIYEINRVFNKENKFIKKIDEKEDYDLIISDGRYGAYIKDKPSLLIMHQLKFKSQSFLKIFDSLTEYFNNYYFSNFDKIIIPDNKSESQSLSGDISKITIPSLEKKSYYTGILCNLEQTSMSKDIDVLVSISGPEPYRSNLEEIIMKQVTSIDKKNKIVLLGKPGNELDYMLDNNTRAISHVSRDQMAELMNRSKIIITRSGYTTIMELANIEHKKGLFIPTPGCLEQEYLSQRYMDKKWFYSIAQDKLNLTEDIKEIDKHNGFPEMSKSKDNVKKLYDDILIKYLN